MPFATSILMSYPFVMFYYSLPVGYYPGNRVINQKAWHRGLF